MPISRLVQQLKADVTEAADEAVVGIEMVQAFGREDDVQLTVRREGASRPRRRYAPGANRGELPAGLLFLPTVSIAVVLGRRPQRHPPAADDRRVLPLLRAAAPARLAARGARLDHQPRPARARVGRRSFAWLELIDESPSRPPAQHLPEGRLEVRFEGVHFSYGTGSEVLRGVDARVEAGEIVAVCGPTGSGKTTLLDLLPRFYDPTRGHVFDRRRRRAGRADRRAALLRRGRDAASRPLLRSRCATTSPPAGRTSPWDDVLAACDCGRRRRVRRRVAGRLRHAHRRARRQPVRRTAPARRARPRPDRGRARPRARRPALGGRHRDRAALVDNLRPAVAGRTVLVATQRLSTRRRSPTGRSCSWTAGSSRTARRSTCSARDGHFKRLFGDELLAA